MFLKILSLFLLLFTTDDVKASGSSLNDTLDIFSQISTIPSYHLDVYSKRVVIKCPILSDHENKYIIRWKFNKKDVASGNGITISKGSLSIESFDAQKHNGFYSCILMVDQLTLRGPDIWVQKKDGPNFTIQKQTVAINGNAVFTCFDNPNEDEDQFQVQWYKDNQPVKVSNHIDIWDTLLFIKNVSLNDLGLYHCEVTTNDGGSKEKSKEQPLSISSDLEEIRQKVKGPQICFRQEMYSTEYPTIQYVSKVGEVQEGKNFTVFCASRVNTDVVDLYQHDERHSYLIAHQNGHILQVIKAKKSVTYSCEVESNRIRARENINVKVISLPKILNPHSFVISELVSLKKLRLECVVGVSDPPSKISWYKDGADIEKQHLHWLEVSQMRAENTGLYQCIVSNAVGSTMKLFYVSLQITGLTPRDVKINFASPLYIDVYWDKPSDADVKKPHHYMLTLTNTKGESEYFTTTQTSVEVNRIKIDGDTEYLMRLCFAYEPEKPTTHCAYGNFFLPETNFVTSPSLKSIKRSDELVYKIEWQQVMHGPSAGSITHYTVHVVPFFGQIEGREQIYYQMDPSLNHLTVELKNEGSYKVWVTANTFKGETPRGSEMVLITNDIGPESNPYLIQVKWSPIDKNAALVSWKPANLNHILVSRLDYKLFYINIPYKDYWREVKTVETNESSIVINNLNSSSVYRFTVVHIVYKRQIAPRERRIESQTSNAYLVPLSMVTTHSLSSSTTSSKIPAPKNARCINISFMEKIYAKWDPIPKHFNISGYKINVFNEVDGLISVYETRQSAILLKNLSKGYWYGIQIHGFGDKGTVYEKTDFLSCRTTSNVPSKPRDVHYSFVFDTVEDTAFLRLKWKPPLYTGTGIYQYEIKRISKQLTTPGFPFIESVEHLVMEPIDENDDGYLHCEAVWTDRSRRHPLQQIFQIRAMTDQGMGENYTDTTHTVFFSKYHQVQTKPEVKVEEDNRIGILVGICVSFAFMAIFIVICLVKEPCRRQGGGNGDNYLYQQRLLEVMSSQSTTTASEESGESSIQQKKKKRRWKFFPILRKNSQKLNSQYETTNYRDSGIRISYSSGSSGRRAHECSPERCPPNCTTSCSILESASDSSSGRITFASTPN